MTTAKPVARGGAGGATHPPNHKKGPLFATKWGKNEVFVRGLGLKGPLFGKPPPPPPKKILAMGLLHTFGLETMLYQRQ